MKRYSVTEKETVLKEKNRARQARYCQNSLKNLDGTLLTRLQTYLSPSADAGLKRLIEATGKTKREIIEQAIVELEKSVTL